MREPDGQVVMPQGPPPRSRFPDHKRAFLGSLWRALFPLPPHEVNRMTPSQIAAVLGLDLESAVSVVPFEERPFVREEMPTAIGERTIGEVW